MYRSLAQIMKSAVESFRTGKDESFCPVPIEYNTIDTLIGKQILSEFSGLRNDLHRIATARPTTSVHILPAQKAYTAM